MHAWGLRPRGIPPRLAFSGSSVIAFPFFQQGRHPVSFIFAAQYPACIFPCQRFSFSLRFSLHDSGPLWLASPLTCDSLIHYNLPVYPGALEI
jgi:hypothetical protein